jgi:CRISPR-associated protein Csm1
VIDTSIDGQSVVLAALLHDIGKFWQRTCAPSPPSYAAFTRDDYGAHGAHAKWSAACYEQIVPLPWRRGAHDVLTHHRPQNYSAKILALADHLAASEREDQDTDDASPQSARLISVFSRIYRDEGASSPVATHRLVPLTLDGETVFPGANHPPATPSEYGQLWNSFLAEAAPLVAMESFPVFLTTLLALLEKYTWCVPSAAFRSRPDVSLYDHARVTAALAVCLWQAAPPEPDLDALLADWQRRTEISCQKRFALIAGDLSGVQRFLYRLASRGAARTLRGRSLFLQLLSEAAASDVLRSLDLPASNLIYVGGAKFYILAPAAAIVRLAEIRSRLARILLAVADGDLYLALGATALSAFDLVNRLPEAWGEVGARVAEAKARRWAEIVATDYAQLFDPRGTGGPVSAGEVCDVCGQEFGDSEEGWITDGVLRCRRCRGKSVVVAPLKICAICRAEIGEGVLREGATICSSCDDYRDLGEAVTEPGALFLTISNDEPPASAPSWQQALFRFGRRWDINRVPYPDRPGALVYAVNTTDFRRFGAHGFRLAPYLAPRVQVGEPTPERAEPQEPGEIKSFAWLAASATGVPYLGLLRMDVDGLGRVFTEGLGESATLSRVASLSRSLRFFFEGSLRSLVQAREGGSGQELRSVGVIYAGGDDFFLVGPWSELPGLARAIRRAFGAYCADNPRVTISGGLAVADPHYPLYQLADLAKEALDERAKGYLRPSGGPAKDALCFLDQVVGWEDYDRVEADAHQLIDLVVGKDGEAVPRALVHDLASIAAEHHAEAERHGIRRLGHPDAALRLQDVLENQQRASAEAGRVYYGRWTWLARYQISRLAERLNRIDRRLGQQVEALANRIVAPERIATLGLIARWAEYLLREEG